MNQCPECKAKIIWGLADPEQMEGVDVEPGDIVVAGCLLGEKDHSPRCGANVLTGEQCEKGESLNAQSATWGW